MGYQTSRGRWLVLVYDEASGIDHPVMALLHPAEDGFYIEAGTYFYHTSN